jgi:hypothetical protein
MNRATQFGRAHYDQGPPLEKFAPVTVVRRGVLAISVSHRRNRARPADRELHFLLGIRLESALLIQSFHGDKREVLAVRLKHRAVRGQPQSRRLAGGDQNALRDDAIASKPTALKVPGA